MCFEEISFSQESIAHLKQVGDGLIMTFKSWLGIYCLFTSGLLFSLIPSSTAIATGSSPALSEIGVGTGAFPLCFLNSLPVLACDYSLKLVYENRPLGVFIRTGASVYKTQSRSQNGNSRSQSNHTYDAASFVLGKEMDISQFGTWLFGVRRRSLGFGWGFFHGTARASEKTLERDEENGYRLVSDVQKTGSFRGVILHLHSAIAIARWEVGELSLFINVDRLVHFPEQGNDAAEAGFLTVPSPEAVWSVPLN